MKTASIKLGSLKIEPPLMLAPMAGLTHSALRTIHMKFGGVGLLSTEMLSARRLPAENPDISPYLIRTPGESPLSYQLFLTSVGDVDAAIDALHRFGADAVDINLGCPAPTIRSAGGGSSLMDIPDIVQEIIARVRKKTELPLTAKIRLGETLDKEKLRNFCLLLEGEGVDLLTVHARLRRESFSRPPRWKWAGLVKQWLSIPVVANGSIFSIEDGRRCLESSGADGLMIGRAAAEKPWIFAEIARQIYGCNLPAPDICLPLIYQEFCENLVTRFRSERRLGRLKEFTHYISRNYPFGHHLASAVQSSGSFAQARKRAASFFTDHDPVGWEIVQASFSAGRD